MPIFRQCATSTKTWMSNTPCSVRNSDAHRNSTPLEMLLWLVVDLYLLASTIRWEYQKVSYICASSNLSPRNFQLQQASEEKSDVCFLKADVDSLPSFVYVICNRQEMDARAKMHQQSLHLGSSADSLQHNTAVTPKTSMLWNQVCILICQVDYIN